MRRYTHLTAGAKALREMVANPAARTAKACKRPIMNRVPSGTCSISGLPMSKTRKKNQSVPLKETGSVVREGTTTMCSLKDYKYSEKEPCLMRWEKVREAAGNDAA